MYVQAGERKDADELKSLVLQLALKIYTDKQAAADRALCFYTLNLIDNLHRCLGFKFGWELRSSGLLDTLDQLQQQEKPGVSAWHRDAKNAENV